jgi:hypothetical protein
LCAIATWATAAGEAVVLIDKITGNLVSSEDIHYQKTTSTELFLPLTLSLSKGAPQGVKKRHHTKYNSRFT